MATRVPKGIAAEEPSTQRIRFIRKKSANTMLGKENRTHEMMLAVFMWQETEMKRK